MAGNARLKRDDPSPSVRTRSATKAAASPATPVSSRKRAGSGKASGSTSTPAKSPSNDRGLHPVPAEKKRKKKKSGSPVRRSGRLEQSSKSENNGKGEGSSSVSKPGKKVVLPCKRSADDGDGHVGNGKQDSDPQRPAKKKKKLYDARAYRALFKPLIKKQKDAPVRAKKSDRGNNPGEDRVLLEKHNEIKGDSLENGSLRNGNNTVSEDGQNSSGGEDPILDKAGEGGVDGRKGHCLYPLRGNSSRMFEQQLSATDKRNTNAGNGLSSVNAKGSSGFMRKQFSLEATINSINVDGEINSKCCNSFHDSIHKDSVKPGDSGDGNSGELWPKDSKKLAVEGDRDIRGSYSIKNDVRSVEHACASEEGSVSYETGHDGDGGAESSRIIITKGVACSVASTTSIENVAFRQESLPTDANCILLPERGNTEFNNGATGENIAADNIESFLLNIQATEDHWTCPICKRPETQLFCNGKDCKRSYHLSCVDPPLSEVPPGIWFCLCCVRKRLELGIYSVSEGIESIWKSRMVEVSVGSDMQTVKQYLVKYVGLAHIHDRWISEKEALSEAPDLVSKYDEGLLNAKSVAWRQEWSKPQRLLRKRLIMPPELLDEYFYCDGSTSLPQCYYEWFVKWTGLGYEHATWELESSLFSNMHEMEILINAYETRRDAAKEAYDPSRSEKVKQMRRNQLIKLSNLPDGFPVGLDASYLSYVNKLRERWHGGCNSVMVNDQDRIVKVIIFIASLLSDVCQPFLVITSLESISLWEYELMRLMPTVNFVIYDGHKDTRKMIRDLEFYEESGRVMFKVLLSHADAINQDFGTLNCLRWEVVVVDDCHLTTVSKYLDTFKSFYAECRFLLLGNQLKESISEYLNLLTFLDSEGTQNPASPHDVDSSVQTTNLAFVKQRFDKYCINERKQDQAKFIEFWVPVRFSNVQLEQYCAMLVSNSMTLRSSSKVDQVGALRDILLSTRKCCDHPFLADSSLGGLLTKDLPQEEYLDVGVSASGKLMLLDKILQDLKSRELRVLILFQVSGGEAKVHIGDILDDYLRYRFGADSYERVDSGLAMSKKQAALQKFNSKESGRFVFLLENRACLPSIKLSAVDAVIIYGSDWNPLNDIKYLQKISINSRNEQVKVFRIYSISTVEEMVLLLAKKDVLLETNIPTISRSIGQSLLRWGASHLFDKLDEFHRCNNPSSICLKASCEKPHPNDTLLEIVQLLSQLSQSAPDECISIISKAQYGGATYSGNISLFGESEKASDEDQSLVFWSKLLDGRNPQWRYNAGILQRARRKVQLVNEPSTRMIEENDEAKRKRRKLSNVSTDTNSIQTSPQDKASDVATALDLRVKDNLNSNSQSQEISGTDADVHNTDSEGNAGLRNLQRNLCVKLKPEVASLCGALQLSDDVKDVAERYLEYVMNHHHVSQEPQSLLQAFMLSLCWRAAHSLKIKVNYKESLCMAREKLNFECDEEEVVSVYSKLRMLKKLLPRSTNVELDLSKPLEPTETCSSKQPKPLGTIDQQSIEILPIKSLKDTEISINNNLSEHLVQNNGHCLELVENDMGKLQQFSAECFEEHALNCTELLESGSGATVPAIQVLEMEHQVSSHCRTEKGNEKNAELLQPEKHVGNNLPSDISSLPSGNMQMPDAVQSASSKPTMPSSGHDAVTSTSDGNVQLSNLPSAVVAPSLQTTEHTGDGDDPEVELDVPGHEPLPAQSLDNVGHSDHADTGIGNMSCDISAETGGRNAIGSTKPISIPQSIPCCQSEILEQSVPVESGSDGEHAQPAISENGLAGDAVQQVAGGFTLDDDVISVAVATTTVCCSTLPDNLVGVANQLEATLPSDDDQENAVDIISSTDTLMELPNMLHIVNKQGQTDTSILAATAQLNISQSSTQSMPPIGNVFCEQLAASGISSLQVPGTGFPSSGDQANASREPLTSENMGISIRNQNVPMAADLTQSDRLGIQGLSQQMTHGHTTIHLGPHQRFQIHSRLPSQGLHPYPLPNELLRISKEKELVNQSCDDLKLKLRVECQMELEKVRKKYEVLIQNVDLEFTKKKKMLDTAYKKVVQSRVLSDEFVSRFSENARAAALRAANQQGVRTVGHSQQFQLAHPRIFNRSPSVQSSLPADLRSPSVTPQRFTATTSAAPTLKPNPSAGPSERNSASFTVSPSQRYSSISSIMSASAPNPSATCSQRRPSITSSVTAAVPISPAPTLLIPSIPSTVTPSVPSASVPSQRISPITSTVPPVVSIPPVPALTNTISPRPSLVSGSDPHCTVPVSVSVPPPLQVVNHPAALFSSNNSVPFVCTMPPSHTGPQNGSMYRSPAPHLSFRSPPSIRLPSPDQLGSIPNPQHTVTPDVLPTPVSLQVVQVSMALPSSNVADGITPVASSSAPAVNSAPSVHDLPPSSGDNGREAVVTQPSVQTSVNKDWLPSDVEAFCVSSDEENQP